MSTVRSSEADERRIKATRRTNTSVLVAAMLSMALLLLLPVITTIEPSVVSVVTCLVLLVAFVVFEALRARTRVNVRTIKRLAVWTLAVGLTTVVVGQVWSFIF